MLAAAILLFIGMRIWFTQLKGTGWSQALNPVLWYHRNRGDDLYRVDEGLLTRGNRQLPEVALTFDDGPHPASRSLILETLRQYGVKATFFDVGLNMAKRSDLVNETINQGHEVANHTYNHFRLVDLTSQDRHREINDTDITFYEETGKHLNLLRPPGMRYNQTVLKDCAQLGYVVVGYTTASLDFDVNESSDLIAERTLRRTENGSIILLHDYPPTAKALPKILEALKKRGYRCVTITEMLNHLPDAVRTAALNQLKSNP